MRTVSFSPAKIRKALNKDFVCHAINTEGEPSAGGSHAHSPSDPAGRCSDGVANQNVQVLFLTPAGKIFHTVSGFRSPELLEKELTFARTLFRDIRDKPDSAADIVKAEHRKRGIRPLITQSSRRVPRRGGGGGGGSIQRSLQFDYTFSQRYPMLAMTELEKNPRLLVGNGSSVFMSGSATGGRIGGETSRVVSFGR